MEVKNAKTFTEQMAILKAKGCTIEDETGCLDVLASVNYYRLSAYFLPYRADNHKFKDGTSFYTVYRSYEFDRKMREILWSIIGVIEINLRTRLPIIMRINTVHWDIWINRTIITGMTTKDF